MSLSQAEQLFVSYREAKRLVVAAGYEEDLSWAEELALVEPSPLYVLREFGWVVVNSGFRNAVARKLWPALLLAFHEFRPERVTAACLPAARAVLNHAGKMGAIVEMAGLVREHGVAPIIEAAKSPPSLTRYPWIGKITCWHFAKVLGVDCVKPDVHLQRAAKGAGRDSPLALCREIAAETGDRLTVIDSVLWRYGEQRERRGWPRWVDLFTMTG